MKRFNYLLAAALALVPILCSIGCSMGMSPAPMTREDAKSALEKLSPQDKIRYYASSPMPQAEKEKHFQEIEQKYGVKASDVLGNRPGARGGGG